MQITIDLGIQDEDMAEEMLNKLTSYFALRFNLDINTEPNDPNMYYPVRKEALDYLVNLVYKE